LVILLDTSLALQFDSILVDRILVFIKH